MRRNLFALAFAATTLASSFGFTVTEAKACDDPQYAVPAARDIEIYWGGSWYPGQIIETRGDSFHVRYAGWSASYDEWVDRSRLRQAPNTDSPQVDIYWGGSWYPGVIVEQRRGSYLVHYNGWSTTFDEWVDADRLSWKNVAAVRPTYRPARVEPVRLRPLPYKHYPPRRPGYAR